MWYTRARVVLMIELAFFMPFMPTLVGCSQSPLFPPGQSDPWQLCSNTCPTSSDDYCDDGGSDSVESWCAYGTDCDDCGPRPSESTGGTTADQTCSNSCDWHDDGECDDGGAGSLTAVCDYGTDCNDCGPRPSESTGGTTADQICSNSCDWHDDGECDDGGSGSLTAVCDYGTDCNDCGARPEEGTDEPPSDTPTLPVEEEIGTLDIYDDPNDDRIYLAMNAETGDSLLVRGQKDAEGYPTKVESFEYWSADLDTSEPGWLIKFDDDGWPVTTTGPNGERFEFTYNGDDVTIDYWKENGEYEQQSFFLEPGTREGLCAQRVGSQPRQVQFPNTKWNQDKWPPLDPGSLQKVTKYVHGTLGLVEKRHDFAQEKSFIQEALEVPLNGAVVKVQVDDNANSYPPTVVNTGNGIYEFDAAHRVPNVEERIQECKDYFDTYTEITGYGSAALGALSIALVPVTGGWSLLASIYSSAVGGCAIAGNIISKRCSGEYLRQALELGSGLVGVNLNVKKSPSTSREHEVPTVAYNLWDLQSKVLQNNSFTVNYTIDSCDYYTTAQELAKQALEDTFDAPPSNNTSEMCAAIWYRLQLLRDKCLTTQDLQDKFGFSGTLQAYKDELTTQWEQYCTDKSAYDDEVIDEDGSYDEEPPDDDEDVAPGSCDAASALSIEVGAAVWENGRCSSEIKVASTGPYRVVLAVHTIDPAQGDWGDYWQVLGALSSEPVPIYQDDTMSRELAAIYQATSDQPQYSHCAPLYQDPDFDPYARGLTVVPVSNPCK